MGSLHTDSDSSPTSKAVAGVLGSSRLIVGIGVFSAFMFSLALFIASAVQAYHTILEAFSHLGEKAATKHLMVAAVEQADLLLVALALLIISLGMYSLFIRPLENVPSWLHINTFDDLKQKLIGLVIVALAVDFFSVAVEWQGGTDILQYGLALAAVVLAVGTYSVILSRQTLLRGHNADDAPDA